MSVIQSAKSSFRFVAMGMLLPFAITLTKFLSWMSMSGTRRKLWMIENGWETFHSPDDEAIRECGECGYVGTLAIDKHRPAPMSRDNWGLFCPECRNEVEGPVYQLDAGDYVNLCRSMDIMGETMQLGPYAAYKTVQNHNQNHTMSVEYIRKCERAQARRSFKTNKEST